MVQTGFGSDIGFSMRTFWFNAQTSSSTGQDQTVECNLRLDPIASVSSTQPRACSCYTQSECAAPGTAYNLKICSLGSVVRTLLTFLAMELENITLSVIVK